AWRQPEEADDGPSNATESIAGGDDPASAAAVFDAEAGSPRRPRGAANDRRWLISTAASVAVLGLAGLLALQFERSPQGLREAAPQAGPTARVAAAPPPAPPATAAAPLAAAPAAATAAPPAAAPKPETIQPAPAPAAPHPPETTPPATPHLPPPAAD